MARYQQQLNQQREAGRLRSLLSLQGIRCLFAYTLIMFCPTDYVWSRIYFNKSPVNKFIIFMPPLHPLVHIVHTMVQLVFVHIQ